MSAADGVPADGVAARALAWLDTRPAAPAALADRVREAVRFVQASGDKADPARASVTERSSAASGEAAGVAAAPTSVQELLAEAGLDRLRRALDLARAARPPEGDAGRDADRPPPRAAALDLLAADALITYAFEAAAEAGADAVERLADAYDPARFARLLSEDLTDPEARLP